MNRLPTTKRVQILNLLVEGMSLRAASRVADISINTVYKLFADAGRACAAYHDANVRNVRASRIQADEVWSFCYAKQKNVPFAKKPPPGAGDIWTWTALDSGSKLIVSYMVGDRSGATAMALMKDLHGRLATRVQLTTDGHAPYLEAVERAFGSDVDFAQLVKHFSEDKESDDSPIDVSVEKRAVTGSPKEAYISTSHVERSNLTLRMGNRRFTRRTNAHSKRIEKHYLMLSLFLCHYNWVRIHSSLRVTPAMEAGLTKTLHDMEWIVGLTDARSRYLMKD